jgi:mono/diheme cytochrome c family protein
MKRLLACWGIALGIAAAVPWSTEGQSPAARDVTFSRDVAPIVFANCAYCHRPGEIAPFSLLTFKDARPWAQSIKRQVVKKTMPPWNAHPGFSQFQNPRVLTPAEIDTLAAWADGGAK